jgi:hypothetical protein
MKDLTILITANFVKSHPKIKFIKQVIDSLSLCGIDQDTPIVITHDALNTKIAKNDEVDGYKQYFINLKQYCEEETLYKNLIVTETDQWGHLTLNVKHGMQYVNTKYVLVLQHDIAFVEKVPVYDLIDLMEKHKEIKHLRFNTRTNLPTWQEWDGWKKDGKTVFQEVDFDGVKLCYTQAWSDQSHIVTKEYYENIVFPDCAGSDVYIMLDVMENRLNPKCHENQARYGTYIYGRYELPKTTKHLDGQETGRTNW